MPTRFSILLLLVLVCTCAVFSEPNPLFMFHKNEEIAGWGMIRTTSAALISLDIDSGNTTVLVSSDNGSGLDKDVNIVQAFFHEGKYIADANQIFSVNTYVKSASSVAWTTVIRGDDYLASFGNPFGVDSKGMLWATVSIQNYTKTQNCEENTVKDFLQLDPNTGIMLKLVSLNLPQAWKTDYGFVTPLFIPGTDRALIMYQPPIASKSDSYLCIFEPATGIIVKIIPVPYDSLIHQPPENGFAIETHSARMEAIDPHLGDMGTLFINQRVFSTSEVATKESRILAVDLATGHQWYLSGTIKGSTLTGKLTIDLCNQRLVGQIYNFFSRTLIFAMWDYRGDGAVSQGPSLDTFTMQSYSGPVFANNC